MDLLFKRSQATSIFRRVKFKLWGKVEFDDEEKALIKRYRFDRAMLIRANQPELRRKAFGVGVFWLLLFCLYLFNPDWHIGFIHYMTIGYAVYYLTEMLYFFDLYRYSYETAHVLLATIIAFSIGYWYYHQNRETIFVRDIIHGRYFKCESVIDLARKEAWLETICAFLRQVMESAKHWDGEVRFPIEALPKDEAKQIIIKGI